MDAVEGSGEDEHFVGGEVVEGGGRGGGLGLCRGWGGGGGSRGAVLRGDEVAVVEEGAGFADYEEGEDWPVGVKRGGLVGWLVGWDVGRGGGVGGGWGGTWGRSYTAG